MAFQPSAYSFDIRRLEFKCSWWLQRQANDAVASEGSIFSENHDYKRFFRVAENTYVPIFQGLDQGWANFSERGPDETFESSPRAEITNKNPKVTIT